MSNNHKQHNGNWFPTEEFHYGNRENRSYCRTCNKEGQVAYIQGGAEAAREYRANKRTIWETHLAG
jgi:hypothetical protein